MIRVFIYIHIVYLNSDDSGWYVHLHKLSHPLLLANAILIQTSCVRSIVLLIKVLVDHFLQLVWLMANIIIITAFVEARVELILKCLVRYKTIPPLLI